MKDTTRTMLGSAILALSCTALTSCSVFQPATEIPMPIVRQQELGPTQATGLLVLLPGKGGRASHFVREGIFDMVRELAPNFDVIAPDAHFGYYDENILMSRLELDVIVPAREAGYRQIWFLGISLGSLGSVVYASQHPEQIDGVLLFGPYLGSGRVAQSVMAAPSLGAWDPASFGGGDEYDKKLYGAWTWLKEQVGPQGRSVVFLAYGAGDGPGTIDERLRESLPEDCFATRPGGHHWGVWRPLMRELLPRLSRVAGERARTSAAR